MRETEKKKKTEGKKRLEKRNGLASQREGKSPTRPLQVPGSDQGERQSETGLQARAPAPVQGADPLPAPSAPSPTIYQKDLTTKEELCGKVGWGRGNSKSLKSEEGGVSSHPFLLLRVSGGDPRTGSGRYRSSEYSPSGTGVPTLCAPRSRYKAARTAPPKQPE